MPVCDWYVYPITPPPFRCRQFLFLWYSSPPVSIAKEAKSPLQNCFYLWSDNYIAILRAWWWEQLIALEIIVVGFNHNLKAKKEMLCQYIFISSEFMFAYNKIVSIVYFKKVTQQETGGKLIYILILYTYFFIALKCTR